MIICVIIYRTNAFNLALPLAGAPYPALFDAPAVTADGVYDLSWRVNCSTPVISYELEFRELPHGNWVSLNVPGCANSHSDA